METEDFDLLVVGGGKAGKTLAMDLARSGQRVAMVERGQIGGTCINVACIPTKSLVSSARALRDAQQLGELGVRVDGSPRIDLDLLRVHKHDVVNSLATANLKQFIDSGMDLVIGEATFVGPRTVRVALSGRGGVRMLRGADVVINTGTMPWIPPISGLSSARPLTSNSLLELRQVPNRLLVLGGGYIGVEFAQMFAAFGSMVTLLEGNRHIMAREDADVADEVTRIFAKDGIDVRTGVSATSVRRNGDLSVTVTLDDGEEITGDDLLVAVGRRPVTSDLNLAATVVAVDGRGFVTVDEHLRTTAPHIWAAGDVAGSPQFTHVSLDDYRIIKANLAGGSATTTGRLVPYTVFFTPELARVGLTETEARAAGHDIRVARLSVASIPRARTMRKTAGIWKAIVDASSNRILGAAFLSAEASESITSVQMAMVAGLRYQHLRDAIINHPSMTEGLNLLFAGL
jgi:pyruvate/2-oxoglutarate dehydrogenase complex dihydrolipoamide dehydrogenase (E3) component